MGRYPHHRSYRAYRGSTSSNRRLSKGAKWFLALVLIAAIALSGAAVYLQRYMVYSISGAHMVLPNASGSLVQEQEEPLDLSSLIVENAPRSSTPSKEK